MSEKRWYVYTLCRPDGSPFYVGKGSGQRVYCHAAEARRGHNCHKCNIIRKIWAQGERIQYRIALRTEDETTAFEHERELIASYGRANLANLSDGGEGGSTGSIRTAEQRQRYSRAMKGRVFSPEHLAKLRAMHQNRSPETGARISAAKKGKPRSPEASAKIAAKLKVWHRTPEGRASQSQRASKPRGPMSAAHKAAVSAAKAKTYPGFIAPDGTVYRDVVNLPTFCNEHGLSRTKMWAVAQGIQQHHHGWTALRD